MPTECWWWLALVVYLLLSYTLGWRFFVWYEQMPDPKLCGAEAECVALWAMSPLLFVVCLTSVVCRGALPVLFRIPYWLAYGGRK